MDSKTPVSPLAGLSARLRTASPWMGLALLVVTVLRSLWGPLPKGHDTLLHFYRIAEINALWRQGIFFSRWAPDLMLGYGYPLFHFYPPLSAYLLTLTYWLVGQNAPLAMSLVFACSLVLSGLGMFLLARQLYGPLGGLFAASAYLLSPYLLYQTFERASLSNALAMAFFPLAAWLLVRVAQTPTWRRVAGAALVLAAVLLSHVAASLLFVAPVAVLGLVAAWRAGGKGRALWRRLGAVVAALAGGLALSAFFWLPAGLEFSLTQYGSWITAPDVDFRLNFVQLLRWPELVVSGSINPPLPMTLGVGQLALGILALGWSLARLWRRRQQAQRAASSSECLTVVSALSGLALAFLATPLSLPLWENISLLQNVQWPWRCLDVATFFLALACGRLGQQASAPAPSVGDGKSSPHAALGRAIPFRVPALLLGFALILFFANAVPYLYPPRWQSLPLQPTLADTAAVEVVWGIYGLTSWSEYTPATARISRDALPPGGAGLGATLDTKLRKDALPNGALLEASGGPLHAQLHLRLPERTTLAWDTLFFVGWSARVDGKPVAVEPDELGCLSLSVPEGEHTVEIGYGETALQSFAGLLSLLAAGVLTVAFIVPRRRQDGAARRSSDATHTPAPVALVALLLALALVRLLWLDRYNSPAVHHLQDGQIAGVTTPVWIDFASELRLVGYCLEKSDRLALYWQAQRPLFCDYRIRVTLADARGVPLRVVEHTHPAYSLTSRWEPFQLVRDEYILPLDEAERPLGYRLTVAVIGADGTALHLLDSPERQAQDVPIGTAKLPPGPLPAEMTAQAVGRTFGEVIELQAAQWPAELRTDSLSSFALVWKSRGATRNDYTVFIHLLHPDGTLAAAADAQPCQGLYPTSYWSPGEVLLDQREWQATLAPGEYQIEIGLYDLETGQRLPLTRTDAPPADSLLLGSVRITK